MAEPFPDRAASRLAHELKTPLAMIVGYAELLQTRQDDEIRAEAPQRILEAAERLAASIDELVALVADERADPVVGPPGPSGRARPG